jgi:hypothetical protein
LLHSSQGEIFQDIEGNPAQEVQVLVTIWPEPVFPSSPTEQRRIRNRLIAFAIIGFVGLVVSFLAR